MSAADDIASAKLNLLRALDLLERHAATDMPDPRLLLAAYVELLDCKHHLAAVVDEITGADTERPSHLRVVQ